MLETCVLKILSKRSAEEAVNEQQINKKLQNVLADDYRKSVAMDTIRKGLDNWIAADESIKTKLDHQSLEP